MLQRFQNDFAAIEPDHLCDDRHDEPSDHAGFIPLDRGRWQLPDRARFFYTIMPWAQVFWAFFREHLLDRQDIYLLAGDECVVTKAGKRTHGLDYFFSSLRQKHDTDQRA